MHLAVSIGGIPHLAKNERDTPNFLHAALDRTACAPFFEERRMRRAERTKVYRKSGIWGTRLREGAERLRMHPDAIDFRQTDWVRTTGICILDIKREPRSSLSTEVNGAQCDPSRRRRRAREGIRTVGERSRPCFADAAS